jgi:hypothetical protein
MKSEVILIAALLLTMTPFVGVLLHGAVRRKGGQR